MQGNTVTTIELTTDDLRFVSESLSVLADLDEGEHWDYDRLLSLATAFRVRAVAGAEETAPAPCDVCGSGAVERADDGTLLGCVDCGYEAAHLGRGI